MRRETTKLMAMALLCVACLTPAVAQNISEKRQVTRPASETSFRDLARGMDDAWYKTREARTVADSVLAYQFPSGGWAKNEEMVDWFAIQSPKIFKLFEKEGLI